MAPNSTPSLIRIGFAAALAAAVLLAPTPVAARAEDSPAQSLFRDASRKLREQDVAGAIGILEQALAADPRHPESNVLYQDTAVQVLGQAELAKRYETLAAENPEDPLYAYLAVRLKQPEQALLAFEKQSAKFKGSPWPRVGRARALEKLGRGEESLAALDNAINLAGGEPRFRALQAYALERARKWVPAVDAWKQVIAKLPDDPTARIGLGEAHRGAGNDAEAIAAFEEAATRFPKDPDPPYRLGLVHLDAGRFEEATAAFERALGLDRSMVEALIGASQSILKGTLAIAKEGVKEPDEKQLMKALDVATRAVASNPQSARAHFTQGAVYEALGELDAVHLDSAMEEYQAALDLLPFPGPERVRVLVAKSFVLLRLASWDEAEAVARQALDIDAECVPALIHAAHALCQLGRYEDAIKSYYKPGLKIAKDDARLLYGSGMAFWSAKKQNDARKSLEAAVKADPDNGLYRLSLGELYYELKRYKEAVKETFEATELRPKDPIAWTAYGRACTSDELWEEAVEAFQKRIELDPECIDEYLWAAIIYDHHLKDREKAREYVEKWLERGPPEDPNLESWIDDVLGNE